jgi:hypothetical protein
VQLSHCDIPLKEGHKISLVSVNKTKKNTSFHVILINHNAQTQHYMVDGISINQGLKINPYRPITICILGIASGLTSGIVTQSPGTGIAVMFLAALFGMFIFGNSSDSTTKAIDEHLSFLGDAIIENGNSA